MIKLLITILFIASSLEAQEKPTEDQASNNGANFVKISERIDTSGQPSLELLKQFKSKNYDLVINLAPPLSKGSIMQEGGLIALSGTRYVNIPVDWNNPTLSDFDFFSHVLNAPGHNKVLIHCQINMRGSLFTFLYRVIYEKTDPEIAQEKMHVVWVPDNQWKEFAQMVLDRHKISFKL